MMKEPPIARFERRPSFFKVLYGDFIDRLQIPPAFVKNFRGPNGAFPGKYLLCDSGDRCWSVEINGYDKNMYFDNGWKEFLDDNSLEIGDILVFIYHGSSEFLVQMYDKSCCEREVESDHEKGRVDDTKSTRRGDENDGSKIRNDGMGVATRFGSKNKKQEKVARNAGSRASKELSSSDGDRNRASSPGAAHHKTRSTSKLPKYTAIMRSACLYNGKMIMPRYLRNYAEHQQFIKLKTANKTWKARFNVYERVCMLGMGWLEFVKDNDLREGDICVFKLVDVKDVTLAVSIFK